LRLLLEVIGRERIALGSDYPFPLGEETPGSLIESMADLDATTRDWLLSRAAPSGSWPPWTRHLSIPMPS
jgi:aminocarboxymuconate-semialdehyde decarboxylase